MQSGHHVAYRFLLFQRIYFASKDIFETNNDSQYKGKRKRKKVFRVTETLFFGEKYSFDTKIRLDKYYPSSEVGEVTIREWFAKFRTGDTRIDVEHSGRPEEAFTDDDIKKIPKRIQNSQRKTLIDTYIKASIEAQ